PLVKESIGVSISAFYRHDPGYIDNTYDGRKDINGVKVDGGRAALLWRPADGFSADASVLVQDSYSNYSNEEDLDGYLRPIDGGLKQLRYFHALWNVKHRLYNLTLDRNLGWGDLKGISSYQTIDIDESDDLTYSLGDYVGGLVGIPNLAV